MAAKQSSAMDRALRLMAKGLSQAEAARKAGVNRRSLRRAQVRVDPSLRAPNAQTPTD